MPWSGPARSPPGRSCTWATCPRSCSSRGWKRSGPRHGTPDESADEAVPGVTPLADIERQAILSAIRALNGDKLQAARLLGIGKTTLYRKLKEYGIADPLRDE